MTRDCNIIYYGSDVNSASSLLGHSLLVYTQRYERVVDELKEKAIENLPNINLS
jgi:site-specific recombinase XerD